MTLDSEILASAKVLLVIFEAARLGIVAVGNSAEPSTAIVTAPADSVTFILSPPTPNANVSPAPRVLPPAVTVLTAEIGVKPSALVTLLELIPVIKLAISLSLTNAPVVEGSTGV